MDIRSIQHRGLRHLIEDDNARFLPPQLIDRVRNVLTVLVLAESMDELRAAAPPGWRVHALSGNREGQWSISVSRNWRITFEEQAGSIEYLDLEDYH